MSNERALRAQVSSWLDAAKPALLVRVTHIQGSTPREVGARMCVGLDEVVGTIGGGHLEWQAISQGRQALKEQAAPAQTTPLAAWTQRCALGPTLGQCCGGVVDLAFEPLSAQALAAWPLPEPRFKLDLHGAGHVGQAIVNLLQGLDAEVRWIDQRLDATDLPPGDRAVVGLPTPQALAQLPPHIHFISTDDAAHEATHAPDNSFHLVLTHRHDLDLAIVDALLRRPDVIEGRAWVGLIGSKTKRASFEHRLLARGHAPEVVARMCCPIGTAGISGKEPAVIAIAVLAQLLQLTPTSLTPT